MVDVVTDRDPILRDGRDLAEVEKLVAIRVARVDTSCEVVTLGINRAAVGDRWPLVEQENAIRILRRDVDSSGVVERDKEIAAV